MDKKKRKQFYINKSRKVRKYELEVGLKGFLCSCNNREKDCIREAYNLLNKYADILYEQEETPVETRDIEDDLSSEVKRMKSEGAKKFQMIDSGAKNFLFIRTTLDDPLKICNEVIDDILKENSQQTKFLLRLLPVETISKAKIEDIKTALTGLVEKYFTDEMKSFSIAYNRRNNNSLSKDDVIKEVAEMIGKQREKYTVDLKNSDVTVLIEVVKSYAFLAVIPGYHKHKRFNLHSLCTQESNTTVDVEPTTTGDEESNTIVNVESKAAE